MQTLPITLRRHVVRSTSPQAVKVLQYMERNGSISAREATMDLDVTSATLARRICDLEAEGVPITRQRKTNPATGKRYTRYSVAIHSQPMQQNAHPPVAYAA